MNQMTPPQGRTNSELMRFKMQLTSGTMHEAFEQFWAREDLTETLPGFMVLLHQIMRASVPLMETAAVKARETAETDPLCKALAEYYEKHCYEEQDHDLWTLNDLEAAGFDPQAVLNATPLPDVAGMAGAQYYWIHHHHPVMLMGYIAVLEGSPPTSAHIDAIQARTGLPEAFFRTYRFHGDVDPHHLEDLDRAIDELPLTPHDMSLIGLSAMHTATVLADCVNRLGPDDAPARLK
ncbi:MAG: iron-containing redox enzyme family protein [Pseudomonadota bacterium]